MPSRENILFLKKVLLEEKIFTAGLEFFTPTTFRSTIVKRFQLDCKMIAAPALIPFQRKACLSDGAIDELLLLRREDRQALNFDQDVWEKLRSGSYFSQPDFDFELLKAAAPFAEQFFSIGFEDSDLQLINLLRVGEKIADESFHLLLPGDDSSDEGEQDGDKLHSEILNSSFSKNGVNFLLADSMGEAAKIVCGKIFSLAHDSPLPLRIGLLLPRWPSPLPSKIIAILRQCGITTANAVRGGRHHTDPLFDLWVRFQRTHNRRDALPILQFLMENEMMPPEQFLQLRRAIDKFCEQKLGDRCEDFPFPEGIAVFFSPLPMHDRPRNFYDSVRTIFDDLDFSEDLEALEAANGIVTRDDFLRWLDGRMTDRRQKQILFTSPDAKILFIDRAFKFLDDFDHLFILDCSEKNFPSQKFHPILNREMCAEFDEATRTKVNIRRKMRMLTENISDCRGHNGTSPLPNREEWYGENLTFYGAIDESENRPIRRILSRPFSAIFIGKNNPIMAGEAPEISLHFLPQYLEGGWENAEGYLAVYGRIAQLTGGQTLQDPCGENRPCCFANSDFQMVHQWRRTPDHPFGIYDFGIDRRDNEPSYAEAIPCKAWENSFMDVENFWLKHILHLDFRRPQSIFETLKMIAGTEIHRRIEEIIRCKRMGHNPESPEVRPSWPADRPFWKMAFEIGTEGKIADLERQIEDLFRDKWQAIKIEQSIGGEIDRPYPIAVRGRVDLLLEDAENFSIIDFKTGTNSRLSLRRIRDGKFLQIALYGLLFRRSKPRGAIAILAPFSAPQSMPLDEFDRIDCFWSDFSRLQRSCNFGLRKTAAIGNSKEFAFSHSPIDNEIIGRRLQVSYPTFFLAERDLKKTPNPGSGSQTVSTKPLGDGGRIGQNFEAQIDRTGLDKTWAGELDGAQ